MYVIVTTQLLVHSKFIVRGTRACTINLLHTRSWVVAGLSLQGGWGIQMFEFKTAQICRRIASGFVQVGHKCPQIHFSDLSCGKYG